MNSKFPIMKKSALLISFLTFSVLLWNCTPKKTDLSKLQTSSNIRLNQLGYLPGAVKKAVILSSDATEFQLVDTSGKKVFSAKLEDKGVWDLSKDTVKVADFSSFNLTGTYRITVKDLGLSYPFKIDAGVYSEVLNASIKGYYLQRASTVLEEKYAGPYNHPMAHPDDKCFYHPSTGKKAGTMSSPKGWYDAGDYNKYMVNAGVTVSTLLTFYENYPQAVGDNSLNIPESGNGVSDLLDEIKYELDWAETMQDADGGVFFKLTSKSFSGFIKPQDDTMDRFVVGKSTSSSLNFAAMFAQAGRVWKSIDPVLSEKYLSEAKLAWLWAIKNPAIAFRNPDGVSTGEYGHQDFKGDFYWASAELFASTGDSTYSDFLAANAIDFSFVPGESWRTYLKNLGYYALLLPDCKLPEAEKEALKKSVLAEADIQLANLEKCPYREPLSTFVWGSNSDVLDIGVIFAQAYKLTKDKKYLNGAVETTDYVFGKNAIGISFVTGFGSKSTMFPHQRLSVSDGVEAPLPGWLAGGPNQNLNDAQSERNPGGVKYKSTEPAKAYMDLTASYASNEIAINWNAPLVYMTGFLAMSASDSK
jgi:endoglucanase